MMRVELKKPWFAPGDPMRRPGEPRVLRGARYRKGVHEMPEELRDFLPKSAIILDAGVSEYADEPEPAPEGNDLHVADLERVAGEQQDEVMAEASDEENRIAEQRKKFAQELKGGKKTSTRKK